MPAAGYRGNRLAVPAKASFDRLGEGGLTDSLIQPLLPEEPSLGMQVRRKGWPIYDPKRGTSGPSRAGFDHHHRQRTKRIGGFALNGRGSGPKNGIGLARAVGVQADRRLDGLSSLLGHRHKARLVRLAVE
jgi:hypothetical protein